MHDEPQVSRRGEWGDVAIVEDNKGRLDYYCQYCSYKCRSKETILKHVSDCIDKSNKLINEVDFVICQFCNFHAQNLGIHLKRIHNITSKDYIKQFPSNKIMAENSFAKYSKSSKENGNWIKKAIENNEDLTEYWAKVSAGVKNAIASDPNEIKRRSELMGKINQTDLMRRKSSETAKITSARPEVQSARAKQLKNWRDENPDDFYNKCVSKMINNFQSKPEKCLFEFLSSLSDFSFIRNQFVRSKDFSSKTQRKQIDITDKEKRIYVEFDGEGHFTPFRGDEILNNVQIKDKQLDQYIINNNYTLIRVGYDQFIYKTKMVNKVKEDNSHFKQECLDKIIEILNSNQPGVYKIGDIYGKC